MDRTDNPDSLQQEDVREQPVDELVESEKYSEFVESYSIDDTEAATHRARRSPRRSRLEPLLGVLVIIALLFLMIYVFAQGQYRGLAAVIVLGSALVLIFSSMSLDAATSYQARKSQATDRDLICYEIQGAIEDYRHEDYEAVYQHLSNTDTVLSQRREQGLSNRMRKWLQYYLHRVENAVDKEGAIEETFDHLAVHFIDDLMGLHDIGIRNVVESIDVEEEGNEETGSKRALLDVWKTVGSGATSRYGVIIFSFLSGGIAYFVTGSATIATGIPSILLAIYAIW